MALRLRILEYMMKMEDAGENANLFQSSHELDLRLDILARELKVMIDKGCLVLYEGGLFELTKEGERELKQLKGEYSIPSYYHGKRYVERGMMEQIFQIDLRKIEGEGEFPCPACGEVISPDDYSGITYSILNIKTKEDGAVQEIAVQCGKCGSIISLDGFDAFQDLGYSD